MYWPLNNIKKTLLNHVIKKRRTLGSMFTEKIQILKGKIEPPGLIISSDYITEE